jgi:hypothetical protein
MGHIFKPIGHIFKPLGHNLMFSLHIINAHSSLNHARFRRNILDINEIVL